MQSLLKTAKLIWASIAAQMLIIGAVAYFVYKPHTTGFDSSDTSVIVVYISYILILTAIPGSYSLYNYLVKKTPKDQPEELLFARYRTSLYVKYALLEGAALFAIVAYAVSGSSNPLYAFFIPIVVLLMSKPSEHEFRKDFFPQHEDSSQSFDNEEIENEYSASDEKVD